MPYVMPQLPAVGPAITLSAAARRLRCARETVLREYLLGRLRIVMIGSRIGVVEEDVEKILAERAGAVDASAQA